VPAYAQTQSILVRGTVVDTRGIPVANARIRFDYESDRQQRFSGVTQVDGTYEVNLSSIETAVRESPSFSVGSNASTLSPNYPNPFNPSTVIPYTVAAAGPVEISIYNILGHRVTTLVRSDHTPGLYSAIWNGRDDAGGGIAAGVYLFVLRTVDSVQRGKMVPLSRGPGQSVQYRWNPRPGGQRRARQPGGVFIAE
jgi:hypothetical protein